MSPPSPKQSGTITCSDKKLLLLLQDHNKEKDPIWYRKHFSLGSSMLWKLKSFILNFCVSVLKQSWDDKLKWWYIGYPPRLSFCNLGQLLASVIHEKDSLSKTNFLDEFLIKSNIPTFHFNLLNETLTQTFLELTSTKQG